MQRQIYELVKKRPRTVDELMAALYWLHPADAPDRTVIKAQVWHINRRLTDGRIVGSRGRQGDGLYRYVGKSSVDSGNGRNL